MRLLKAVFTLALLASALLPWNATAIDRADFAGKQTGAFNPNYAEDLLVKSLLEITQGQLQQALTTVDEVLRTTPNFKLAHLVRGDLLMALSQQFQGFGNTTDSSQVEALRTEAQVRLEHYLTEEEPQKFPEPLWQLEPNQQHVIVVDASKSRLYVYRNEGGRPRYVADYYVTLGKNGSGKSSEGDKRTPLGVYFASSKLDKKLPDFYGDAAYPLNYPNVWDKHQGKSGHGIWLHGTPTTTYSRPPRASDGCVVIANQDLKSLAPILSNGKTPVIIANNIEWLEANAAIAEKASLSDALENWRRDWQAQDTDSYLAHYSKTFFSAQADLAQWAKEKRYIQARKSKVEITLSNISMFRYPDKNLQMALVSFDQDYKSGSLDSRIRKRQYWVLEDQHWKIMYEGPA
ncbi:MAG TPA: L,D-transpeptidase family protein [Methylophilaceae bacterium]|nr:L,D-transpeptidase family protein [Methylophilaceae bacterium]